MVVYACLSTENMCNPLGAGNTLLPDWYLVIVVPIKHSEDENLYFLENVLHT